MIRPFRAETERYGHYSVAGEFVYDHPFQWGSKRTGPDLQRVGGTLQRRVAPHAPRSTRATWCPSRTCRPTRGWRRRTVDAAGIAAARCGRCARVGVPYTDDEIAKAPADGRGQDRDGRAGRLPAGAGHSRSSKELAMDINDPAHQRVDAWSRFVAFLGIVCVGLQPRRNATRFDEAAQLPFARRRRLTREHSHERLHQPASGRSTSPSLTLVSIVGCAAAAVVHRRASTPRRRPATTPPATSGTRTSPR